MRWTKIIVVLLLVGMIGYTLLLAWPFVAPATTHHTGILLALLNGLLVAHQGPWGLPISASGGIVLGLGLLICLFIQIDFKSRRRTTHGSAKFASGRHARKYRPLARPFFPFLRPGRRRKVQLASRFGGKHRAFELLLGTYHGRPVVLLEQNQWQHLLLTAPTGAGKSTRFFIPNLLRETGLNSLFIADLKNELYQITAGWLARHMQVWLFAPMQPAKSQGYNPLAHIHSVEDAQDFAETWVTNTGTSKDGTFWESNAKLLISAMTLHLIASEQQPAFSRLADSLTNQTYEEIKEQLSKSRSSDARRIAGQFLENMEKNERLIGSQMTEIGNRFQLLASSNARAVTATNDINFDEMIDIPTAFFLSIPRASTRRYRPLMACLTQQMFAAWEQRKTHGIRCYLDEFTNLGYIPGYADFISLARDLRVSLLMAIQSFSQLDERYGKNDTETIKNNAVTHLLLPGAGLQETRYYSERIGDTTVATETVNRRGVGLAQEITSSQGETRRRLMTSDELRTMEADTMLMLEASSSAILLKTKQYFLDHTLAARANIPCAVTHVRQEPQPSPSPSPRSAQTAQQLPHSQSRPLAGASTVVVDADVKEEEEDDLFFQQE